MFQIPGFRVLGTYKSTGSATLFHSVREVDGLPGLLKTPMVPSPHDRERYRREFAILQRLREVEGVPMAHACEPERPALFIEQVEGTPLSELVGQPLDVLQFLDLAVSLTSSLAEIHRHGVIHKDLKPSNIIITPQGEACIIDFGTATLQRVERVDAAPSSLIEGTLPYMSPEQTGRMNRSVDYRTDFYSLGVTFYEMLTGARPFQGRDALEWFHAHLAQSPKPPHELVPAIAPVLSSLVLKLLAKVAEERYLSAEGLRADLERCRESLRRGERELFPLGTHDFPTHFQLPQQLYGRKAHVSALLQGFERALRGGEPELFLVRGYSGIGKSSVVNELHKPVVQRRGLFLSGKFDQFQRDIPYATLAQAIRGLVQQLLAGSDEELARWRERLREAWQDDGQVLVDVIPQLELVAGRQPAVQPLPPAESQHRFNRVFRRFLGVFATAKHPLVIFLDDVQWADLATLQLLQHLLSLENASPVLWLVAYRDNEVSPSHPLVATVEAVRKAGAKVTELQLEPLSLEHVQHLVADSLPGAGSDVIEPLSALVLEKTGGNPFFLLQMMVTLHQDGLLLRTSAGGWQWDGEGVRAKGYSDNVVDFLVGKLRQLPSEAQHLLRLAACVGNPFSLPMLATLSGRGEVGQVEQALEPVLQEGLLVRSGPEQYRFLHDRIQHAAHALLSPEELPALHLRIGRLLLERLSVEEIREQLFDVVSHLNAGASLMESPAERLRAARLNVEAGTRAKASIAHQSAIAYFKRAVELLPSDAWETEYALTFKLRLDQATCELVSGHFADARSRVEELQPRARTRPDMAVVYCLKSDLYLVTGAVQLAIDCLLEFLASLSMPISSHPSWEEVVAAHEEVWALLGERPIESLVDLPLMTDPDMKAVMDVIASLNRSTFFADHNLYTLLVCRAVALSLQHGNSGISTHVYALFGGVTGWFFKRYREGYAFGLLAQELIEHHRLTAARGVVLFARAVLHLWTQPMSAALELTRSAFQALVEAGDSIMACYPSYCIVRDRLCLGHPLEEVYRESVAQQDFVGKPGFRDMRELISVAQRYVQQMRGLSRSFDTLNGEGFGEEAFEAGLTAERSGLVHCWYWILRMQSRFMCGAYEQAREAGARAAGFLSSAYGSSLASDYRLYHALTLAACYADAAPEQQREYLEAMQQHQQQLAEWATHCPQNFRALERMVSAELARLLGHGDEATCAYEEALQSAQENGFIQHVALANELAARFWSTRRAPSIFKAFARAAREAYRQWGATGKVQHLDSQWPGLASSQESSPGGHTTSTDSSQVDALTVVKAQQAISREIVLERLMLTLMQVAIENAGAQRGALLLPRGDTLAVVATSGDLPDSFVGASAQGDTHALPWSLITYVKRTGEHVLIGDAATPHPFSSDEYLARSKARSVLCLPLLRQEEFYGALYLENSLATNAFTPARLSLLEHLASQAVISFENARLYDEVQRAEVALRRANDELERRVEERTRELKQAQARLVNTAREVGMAEVASNVLHNVGNVLTSAVINFEAMLALVNSSHVEGVQKTAAMLEQHLEDLGDFLTRDPRGSRVRHYLSALGDTLLHEQADLREGLEAMGQHIEHIRAIVRVQQDYAKTALLIEECDLAQLIDDALRIQLAALQRHSISITRELSPAPRVRVDKHKILQILLNLITNAKDAMDEVPAGQRTLSVRLTHEGHWIHIQLVDTGAGFTPEVRKHLFSHGFTTRKEGHGFGLHSCALAAQLLGGRLTLESQGPGHGATATLELPFA
ncbi:ATP-binding sensor histidine kinase [Hyalangium sp.]|uniref:trifunctional serine/threonine-protein kinase/ATP-binding protein/sensor histidine kinase n=1 Tax=Hyalangium sp. TaxID=2028555 RepID=UPI002D59266D|nr:ATP-binding sensor histidine kinase [Hyalangium sp.]HYH99531.1 ATP-binding sensor histidine kinase [Hyalangium sp.]